MRALLLLALLLPQDSALGIHTEYDKFTDTTVVRTTQSIMPVRPGYVLFEVEASVKGKEIRGATPAAVAIVITSHSDNWVFLNTRNDFRVLYNGSERYTLGRMRRIHADTEYGGVIEVLYLEVTLKDVEKLSKADNLEIQIGPLESEVKPEQRASIKRWLGMFEK